MEYNYIFLLIFIILAFFTDVRDEKIPNVLTFSGMIVGLLYHLINSGISGLFFSILGLLTGFGILVILYSIGAVGAGDVKLFCAIGALAGLEFLLYACMYSIIYAGIIGIIIIILRKEFFQRIISSMGYLFNILIVKNIKNVNELKKSQSLRFPFMYAVLPGIITAYYYFTKI